MFSCTRRNSAIASFASGDAGADTAPGDMVLPGEDLAGLITKARFASERGILDDQSTGTHPARRMGPTAPAMFRDYRRAALRGLGGRPAPLATASWARSEAFSATKSSCAWPCSTAGRETGEICVTASEYRMYVSIDATTTRASTVIRSIPTRETRTHASMTIPLSRTRSSTSIRLVPPAVLSTGIMCLLTLLYL